MVASPDFYARLSSLFDHMAHDQDMTNADAKHLQQWPVGSEEQRLLEDLYVALANDRPEPRLGVEEVEQPYYSIFEAACDGLMIVDRETTSIVNANPAACAMYHYTREELIGLPMTQLIHRHSRTLFNKYTRKVQPGHVLKVLALDLRKGGSPFHVEVRWTAFTYRDQSCLLGMMRDVSERVQAERMLKRQVAAHAREQATLLEMSQTLASSLEFKPSQILDQLRGLIEYANAGLFAVEDSTLVSLAVRGPPKLEQAMPFILPVPVGDPHVQTVLFNPQQPNRIADVWSADPSAQVLRTLLNSKGAVLLEGVRAWMWVPLTAKGRIIGGLSAGHAAPGYFTAHHADLALTIANQAATTMINVQLYEHAQILAKLQERQRLAQELHDAVNQSLFSASLIAEVLPRLWEQDPIEGRRSLEDLRRLTQGALAEMRGLLAELRPAIMTGTDFGDLLRQLGSALTGRVNIPVNVTITGQGLLPGDVQVVLYRLCQEALTNIAKHAGASHVEIQLSYDSLGMEVHIMDDGIGFDPEHVSLGHSGLSMMHERAAAIGAVISITSTPGNGTAITLRWTEAVNVEQKTV